MVWVWDEGGGVPELVALIPFCNEGGSEEDCVHQQRPTGGNGFVRHGVQMSMRRSSREKLMAEWVQKLYLPKYRFSIANLSSFHLLMLVYYMRK